MEGLIALLTQTYFMLPVAPKKAQLCRSRKLEHVFPLDPNSSKGDNFTLVTISEYFYLSYF